MKFLVVKEGNGEYEDYREQILKIYRVPEDFNEELLEQTRREWIASLNGAKLRTLKQKRESWYAWLEKECVYSVDFVEDLN